MNATPFSLPLSSPLSTASGTIEAREGFVVRYDHRGETGVGEATPLPGWTEPLDACETALRGVSDPVAALENGTLADAPAARHGVSLAVLVVNNVRDRETDAAAGKRTLAVILGSRASRLEGTALVGMAYAVPVVFWLDGYPPAVLLPLATAPLAAAVGRTVWTRSDGAALNPALERTGRLLFAHSALFAVGLAV